MNHWFTGEKGKIRKRIAAIVVIVIVASMIMSMVIGAIFTSIPGVSATQTTSTQSDN